VGFTIGSGGKVPGKTCEKRINNNNNNNNNNKPLFCYTLELLFHIPPVLVVWRRTTSQTVAFVTGTFATENNVRSKRY
jgi:hypothetical protein